MREQGDTVEAKERTYELFALCNGGLGIVLGDLHGVFPLVIEGGLGGLHKVDVYVKASLESGMYWSRRS